VSKRSWVILGVVASLLIGTGAPSTARADLESDEEPGEQPSEQPSEPPSEQRNLVSDALSWQLLVTSSYMFNAHRVSGPYNAFEYPYADSQGFGLLFAGGDVGYRTDKWGVTLNLRWGQNVDRLSEFAPLTRGFATWIPHEKLSLDLGYFGAFVGVESADEWENPTFTRGIIYFRMQPFRHLGLRATIEPHDKVDVTVIVARGSIFGTEYPSDVRNTVQAPAVGAQVRYRPGATTELWLGGVTSPNGSNGNRDWQAILDFVARWTPKAWSLFIDADYQFSSRGSLTGLAVSKQWGVSLGGSYDITDDWGVGLRGEYFGAILGAQPGTVFTVTGTARYSPVEYLIISLEPRAEFAGNDIYYSRPFVTDPATGNTVPSLNQDWFFGFWIGMTARIGN
jgi:hypothetical protein